MLDQYPGLITAADLPKKRKSLLTIHQKLFGDNHVSDIIETSQRVTPAKQMSKQDIVVALMETCLMLDERKNKFELIISALEKEDVGVAADAEDEEGEGREETEGDDGSENADEEGDNNGEDAVFDSNSEEA